MTKYHTIDSIIENLFSNNKLLLDGYNLGRLQDSWLNLPKNISNGGFPVKYKNEILTIAAVSNVWIQELSYAKEIISDQFKADFADITIKKIIFKPATENELTLIYKHKKIISSLKTTKSKNQTPSKGSPAYKTYEEILEIAQKSTNEYSFIFEKIAKKKLTDNNK